MSFPVAPSPTYGICQLDGYQYEYNPIESTNPLRRSISREETLNGNVFTDYGLIETDRIIVQSWPLMEAEVFWQLWAIMQIGGTVPFIDEWNTIYPCVAVQSLDYASTTTGGVCFVNVKLTLWITS